MRQTIWMATLAKTQEDSLDIKLGEVILHVSRFMDIASVLQSGGKNNEDVTYRIQVEE